MAKLSRMAAAARKRHRIKGGEVDPKEATELKQDDTYNGTSDCSHDASGSDVESVGSAVLRRAGTSVKKFFVGKVGDTAPSPALEPDLRPEWEIEEVGRVVSTPSLGHRV
jgi:hypothetical protein